MKPICVRCRMYYRVLKNGVRFEEGMPATSETPARPRRFAEGMHCALCGPDQECPGHKLHEFSKMLIDTNPGGNRITFEPGNLAGWESYKLWVGDLWECRGCGHLLISGVAREPLAEHYQPGYAERVVREGVLIRVDDC